MGLNKCIICGRWFQSLDIHEDICEDCCPLEDEEGYHYEDVGAAGDC